MHRLSRFTILIATLSALGACTPLVSSGGLTASPDQTLETIVQVENRNDRDMVVYLVSSGLRHRLGMVGPLSSRTFEVSAPALRTAMEVRLVMNPFASSQQTYATELVSVEPGKRLDLQIGKPLVLTSVAVR